MPSANKGKKKAVRINPKMQDFLDGKISIEDLDDEEIRRGQFRSIDGDFKGRPTDIIPRKFYDAVVRETIKRANDKFRQELEPSLMVLREIAQNPRAHADARYKSAVYLIERAAGKVPEKQEVALTVSKWEADIQDLIFEDEDEKGTD